MKNNQINTLKTVKITLFLAFILMVISTLMTISVSAVEPEFINTQLIKTTDLVNWEDIDGTLETGYTLALDPAVTYYYLNFRYAATNTPLKEGFYGFNITDNPLGFFDYWDAKGVNEAAVTGSWQAHAWEIINGNSPTFYIQVDTNKDLHIIDGLQRDFAGDSTAPLMVNGDYPLGEYSYQGNISSDDDDLTLLDINMNFVDSIDPIDNPRLRLFDLDISDDQIDWVPAYGSLNTGYSMPFNSSNSEYYFRVLNSTTYEEIDEGFYGFYQTSAPSGYLAYWAGLGVDASATVGTWEAQMWKIINGNAPMYYISISSTGYIEIIDGLLKDYYGYEDAQFRMNADIPLGTYTFSGALTSEEGIDSDAIEMIFRVLDTANAVVWVDENYDSGTPGWGVDHFASINNAIGASVSGGIINVQPGTFKEIVIINKPIILRSTWGPLSSTITDEDATYTDLSNSGGHTIQIASDYVMVEGFMIERFESVIRTAAIGNNEQPGLSHVEVRNCRLEGYINNVLFSDVDYLSLISNRYTCQYDDNALMLTNISNVIFSDNNVRSYNRYGIIGENISKLYVDNSQFSFKRLGGLSIYKGDTIIIDYSSFTDSETDGVFLNDTMHAAILFSDFEENIAGIRFGEQVVAKLQENSFSENIRNINRAARIEEGLTHYSQIQEAIENASFNADIFLNPGNYSENILINKTIKIHGLLAAEDTILYGDNETPTVLVGGEDIVRDVIITGVTITGGNHSFKTGRYVDVSGLYVDNCIIEDPLEGYAVYIDPHNYTDASSARNGSYIFSEPVVFSNNYIRDHFEYQYWPWEVYYADISLQLDLYQNDIDSVFINGSISTRIKSNQLQTFGVTYSRDMRIDNNYIENPWQERYGIYLWSINNTPPVSTIDISHNSIIGYSSFAVSEGISGQGILIAGAKAVDVHANIIRDCTDGIWVKEEYYNLFNQRCIGFVQDLTIRDNDIEVCQSGIKFHEEIVLADIDGNSFSLNGKGIWLHGSDGHNIANNTFIDNYKGIQFDNGSDFNLVYNNFFSNTVNVYDQFSETNEYNVSAREGMNIMGGPFIGGNYWDDYLGEDIDGDTLGDTEIPYNGSGNINFGADHLPIILTDVTPPFVSVVSPNGGETLNGTVEIRWNAYDDFDPEPRIDIEYSDDAGLTWNMISPNVENNGIFEWDTSSLAEGNEYLIKVTAKDMSGYRNNDTSDATFTIYRDIPGPDVEISNPLTGFLYFFNAQKVRFLSNNCFAFGHLIIEATVDTELQVEKVEFYIDNQLINTTMGHQSEYTLMWDETVLFYHEIKVIAYDIHGNTDEDTVGVTIFNFGIIP